MLSLDFGLKFIENPTKVYRTRWIESQMIIDFRLHTSDNALTENGVQIAVCSMIFHRHFHFITFSMCAFLAIQFSRWSLCFGFVVCKIPLFKLQQTFWCNTNWQWCYVTEFFLQIAFFHAGISWVYWLRQRIVERTECFLKKKGKLSAFLHNETFHRRLFHLAFFPLTNF